MYQDMSFIFLRSPDYFQCVWNTLLSMVYKVLQEQAADYLCDLLSCFPPSCPVCFRHACFALVLESTRLFAALGCWHCLHCPWPSFPGWLLFSRSPFKFYRIRKIFTNQPRWERFSSPVSLSKYLIIFSSYHLSL